jgi:hypothetical protein
MRIDTEVNRLKFDVEIERLREHRSTLEERGIFLLQSSAFPFVNLFYAPQKTLQLLLPASPKVGQNLPPNAMAAIEIPSLGARAFRARFDLTDYDVVPPSVEFFDPWTNRPLLYETMFRAQEYEKERGVHIVLLPNHPVTHKPFLCLRGVREYHEHPQHAGDDWFLYRGSISLFSIVTVLWRVAIDIIRPQVAILTAGDQGQIQVHWSAQEKP